MEKLKPVHGKKYEVQTSVATMGNCSLKRLSSGGSVSDLMLSLPRTWVQSQVRGIRSYRTGGGPMKKKERKNRATVCSINPGS